MAESTGHFKCRILFYLCIFFGMAFVVGICAPAGAGSTPAYGAHPGNYEYYITKHGSRWGFSGNAYGINF